MIHNEMKMNYKKLFKLGKIQMNKTADYILHIVLQYVNLPFEYQVQTGFTKSSLLYRPGHITLHFSAIASVTEFLPDLIPRAFSHKKKRFVTSTHPNPSCLNIRYFPTNWNGVVIASSDLSNPSGTSRRCSLYWCPIPGTIPNINNDEYIDDDMM